MSVKKIAGIETELRLDCGELRESFEDEAFPWKVVENSLICQGGTSNSLLVLPPSLMRKFNDVLKELKTLHPSSQKATEEHLALRKNLEICEKKPSEEWQNFSQRFGFSGGYTFSGFRIYVDGSHPEVSTPECSNPRDLVCWQKAGEKIIEAGRKKTEEETGQRIVLSNDNSDGFGASWGSHENYLVSNELFETLLECRDRYGSFEKTFNFFQDVWISFLVTRFIFCGSGKMGSETNQDLGRQFLISQRAEFISCALSHRTTTGRPFINLRDISYVSKNFGNRLHVIVGDSNMCETAIYLKTGTAMIILMMLEDNFISENSVPVLKEPLDALQILISDLKCQKLLDVFVGGRAQKMTAVDIQKLFCDLAIKWFEERHKNEKNYTAWIPEVLAKLDRVLTRLKENPLDLFGTIDWVTKYNLCNSELERHNTDWRDINSFFRRLVGVCGAYHRLDEFGLYNKIKEAGEVERVIKDDEIERACIEPPKDTRANKRSNLLKHFGENVIFANWDSIYLKCNPRKIILNSPY